MPSPLTLLQNTRHTLAKVRAHEWDRMREKHLAELDSLVGELDSAIAEAKALRPPPVLRWFKKSEHLKAHESLLERVEKSYALWFPGKKHSAIAENLDVILVALVVALGIRCYFLQPFKIPTNSMFPSLRGVVVTPRPSDSPLPSAPAAWADRILCGRTHHSIVLPANSTYLGERASGFFIFRKLDLFFDTGEATPKKITLRCESGGREILQALQLWPCVQTPREIELRFEVSTGDHLFVNKMAYNFRRPERGDSFVFRTMGLETSHNAAQTDPSQGSQYYIKRCVAVGGDTVQVVPPRLMINGKEAEAAPIRRIWSGAPDYHGYSHGSIDSRSMHQLKSGEATPGSLDHQTARMNYLKSRDETYTLPADSFWAMGDNSYNSADSRQFGQVPLPNLVGKALVIYYPFNRFFHWIP